MRCDFAVTTNSPSTPKRSRRRWCRAKNATRSTQIEDKEHLRSALHALPPEQVRLIVLFVVYGLTAQETADLEGIPLGTAKTRIRRGIAKLREALEVSGG